VGSSQADKAASHDRILEIAAARMRQHGIEGVSVADIMAEAGLTHGGFYRHFDSRDDLVLEAITLALWQGSGRARGAARFEPERALGLIIDGYLNTVHRDGRETGCAVAALAEGVARASGPTRKAYAKQVQSYLDLLTGVDARNTSGDTQRVCLILSALVGALAMARAVGDPVLSRRILEDTAQSLKLYVGSPGAGDPPGRSRPAST
jgi:TetR/AcrR family transcriptional repressor of nem operon